jgi:predicted methyltransferase
MSSFTRALLLGVLATMSAGALAADAYDAAVQHAGRPAEDLKRDALDHPADV